MGLKASARVNTTPLEANKALAAKGISVINTGDFIRRRDPETLYNGYYFDELRKETIARLQS